MKNDIILTPLQEQLKRDTSKLLEQMIGEFSCSKDPDVEAFLKEKSIRYEFSGLSRTYLYIKQEAAVE
jgi:hypothetical protein